MSGPDVDAELRYVVEQLKYSFQSGETICVTDAVCDCFYTLASDLVSEEEYSIDIDLIMDELLYLDAAGLIKAKGQGPDAYAHYAVSYNVYPSTLTLKSKLFKHEINIYVENSDECIVSSYHHIPSGTIVNERKIPRLQEN